MILIVDSWAWLAATEEDKLAEKSLSHIRNRDNQLFTTPLNIYEVYYRIKERSNSEEARKFIESIKNRATVIPMDEDLVILASEIHISERLSVVDAFVYATALKLNGKVLTGDQHFKGKENVVFIG